MENAEKIPVRKRRTYKIEDIESLKQQLRAIEDKPKQEIELTATAVVQEIKTEINDLRKRGYTLKEIASMLAERNLPVGVATLKAALDRQSATKKAKNKIPPVTKQDSTKSKAKIQNKGETDTNNSVAESSPTAATGKFQVPEDSKEI